MMLFKRGFVQDGAPLYWVRHPAALSKKQLSLRPSPLWPYLASPISSTVLMWLALFGSPYFGLIVLLPTVVIFYQRAGKLRSGALNALVLGLVLLYWVAEFNYATFFIALGVWLSFYCVFGCLSLLLRKLRLRLWQGITIGWVGAGIVFELLGLGSYWNQLAIFLPVTGPLIATIGALGVTTLMILSQALLVEFAVHRNRPAMLTAAAISGLLIGSHIWASYAVHQGKQQLTVSVVQPNIDTDWEWRVENVHTVIDVLETLTARAAQRTPDIIVWPEYAVPLDVVNKHPEILNRLAALQLDIGRTIAVGTAIDIGDTGAHFDSAAILSNGQFKEVRHASIPIRFNQNTVAAPLQTSPLDSINGAGVLICYEELFGSVAREQVKSGAKYLLSLSNNRGFGYGGDLVLKFSALIAAENQRALARSSNTGVSTVFDLYGRHFATVPMGQSGALTSSINLNSQLTLATRFGALPTYLILLLILVAPAIERRAKFSR